MPYFSALDSAAARSAISRGDDLALERYLREGGGNPVVNITGATAFLTAGTSLFNRAAGITATLPLATGSGQVCTVVIQTTMSGSAIVKVGRAADTFIGMVTFATATFGAASGEAAGGTDDTITLTAANGGVQGTIMTFTDVAPNLWLIQGTLNSTTAAAPFSASV
jgi:hypothetical protein